MFLRTRAHSVTRKIIQFRGYSTTFEEWEIPVPWGHLNGKWWGDKKTVPLIAIHEYRQNSSAYDNLIPKLNVPSVLALDLPGHGLSSPFGKGRNVTHMELVIALRHVTLKLAPGQVSFIGHGLGSFLAFLFSASYMKLVETFISIECGRHVFPMLSSLGPNGFGAVVDRSFEIENSPLVSVTKKELLNIIENTGRMSEEAAEILASRASRPNGDNKVIFTNDPRYECNMVEIRNTADDELIKYSPGEVTGPAALDSNLQQLVRRRGPEVVRKLQEESYKRLRESCRHFFAHEVNTSRHILLDDANETAKIVNDFYSMDFEAHQIISPN